MKHKDILENPYPYPENFYREARTRNNKVVEDQHLRYLENIDFWLDDYFSGNKETTVKLWYKEKKSVADICKILGKSRASIDTYISRMWRLLNAYINKGLLDMSYQDYLSRMEETSEKQDITDNLYLNMSTQEKLNLPLSNLHNFCTINNRQYIRLHEKYYTIGDLVAALKGDDLLNIRSFGPVRLRKLRDTFIMAGLLEESEVKNYFMLNDHIDKYKKGTKKWKEKESH